MTVLSLLIFFISINIFNTRYSVYHSDELSLVNFGFDCLYAHLTEDDEYRITSTDTTYHLIPYCRRLMDNEEQDQESFISSNNIYKSTTFNDLYNDNVTSEQLLNWKAPIDLVEHYIINHTDPMKIFHNCSFPWFGSKCQYSFENKLSLSFDEIVQSNFIARSVFKNTLPSFNIGTCYLFLTNCQYKYRLMCLDWREICDGKWDCINGEDEQYCQILEVSICPDDHYRCHYSGECIPLTFVRDERDNVECLDTTDETQIHAEHKDIFGIFCYSAPTFRCEERTARFHHSFQCGDGQYIPLHETIETNRFCNNGRHIQLALSQKSSLLNIPHEIIAGVSEPTLNLITGILNQTLTNSNTIYSLIFCESTNKECLSKWYFKVELFNAYSMFHFIYLPNSLIEDAILSKNPDFICFYKKSCPGLIKYSTDIGLTNGLVCFHSKEITNESLTNSYDVNEVLNKLYFRCTATGTEQTCSHSSLFYCPLSMKCISKHRLVDGNSDCYYNEDETFSTCQLNDSQRFSCKSEPNKCLSLIALHNGKAECKDKEDELSEVEQNILNGYVSIGLICDGINHPLLLKANETDETNCEYWPCNNPYTRCNTFRNCKDLSDELNCPRMRYTMSEGQCFKTVSTNVFCERTMHILEKLLPITIFHTEHNNSLYSMTNISDVQCISPLTCLSIRELCEYSVTYMPQINVCNLNGYYCILEHILWALLTRTKFCPFQSGDSSLKIQSELTFTSSDLGYFPSQLISSTLSTNDSNSKIEKPTTIESPKQNEKYWFCNRGILVRSNNINTTKCLCPPSYFGDRCQWQNQRISLTLQFEYHEERQIIPYYEQITYVPKNDCGRKYNIYLLYPTKPKNLSANYSIHIDLYNKISLTYLASWHLSIPFQFLPVSRIASHLFLPNTLMISKICPLSCGQHGHCIEYINRNSSYFCRCNRGYSGLLCDIQHHCSCSPDSICLSPSICICPLNKFGSKCYLNHSSCQINPCQNNGLCAPVDDRIGLDKFICLCKENFYGLTCEYYKNRIDIEFDNDKINLMPFIYVHFITINEIYAHQHTTSLKKIRIGQNIITVYIKHAFHIVFIELIDHTYYLVVLREKFIESEHIRTKVISNHRCLKIHELMNITFLNSSFLHRVKYYPSLCRQHLHLKCFYDERYMCICDINRFSNCFTFNTSLSYDCRGENICENNGLCFQDDPKCPIKSVCACPECYYGTKCQFSTESFVFSLDSIIGPHIQQNIPIHEQLFIIKISIFMTTLMLLFGLINGVLSIITFRTEKINNIGCAVYLLVSSWNSLCLIILFYLKFWHLILSHMLFLTNRSYLKFNCVVLDMIVNVLISTNDWLYGCVSIERVFTVYQGTKFNQTKSKKTAKWITVCVFLMIILTHIQDPIHRRLIDDIDIDEQRIWCNVQYSSSINTFNQFMNLFHFLMPFSINLISIFLIILLMARTRSRIQSQNTFREHLQQQFYQYKHHLITLCALLLLSLPRLLISFISGCMKSSRDPWLFLLGYFISFIPSMMTFFIFVLTAKKYKEEFNVIFKQTVRRLRSRLYQQQL
ncbi:hypothetical protein I4U23_003879 [Adineta vaga]|nr:hypothetical protein I4U23_003879 [Adineta vaga]